MFGNRFAVIGASFAGLAMMVAFCRHGIRIDGFEFAVPLLWYEPGPLLSSGPSHLRDESDLLAAQALLRVILLGLGKKFPTTNLIGQSYSFIKPYNFLNCTLRVIYL